jgi:hypothetical protein
MTEENKEIIVKEYLSQLEKNPRIIINVIDDYSNAIKPWVKIYYSVIKTENKIHTKNDRVWSKPGTFNSLFVSEIRDQKLNYLGI